MKVKAKISFSGQFHAKLGQELDIPDESAVLKDLLQAGYVEEIKKTQLGNKAQSKRKTAPRSEEK